MRNKIISYKELIRHSGLTTSVKRVPSHLQSKMFAKSGLISSETSGLYYPSLNLNVISVSHDCFGFELSHISINDYVKDVFADDSLVGYAFNLYTKSYLQRQRDRILRDTSIHIGKDIYVSLENVYNRENHGLEVNEGHFLPHLKDENKIEIAKKIVKGLRRIGIENFGQFDTKEAFREFQFKPFGAIDEELFRYVKLILSALSEISNKSVNDALVHQMIIAKLKSDLS